MLDFSQLNWIALAAATVAGFALGGLWYGPLFGKAWMSAMGKTEADIQPTATPFIISFFTTLVTAVVLAALISTLGIAGMVGGACLGLIVGIGFAATSMASDSAFCGWGVRLFLIQSGYRVVYCVLMGAILGVWQ